MKSFQFSPSNNQTIHPASTENLAPPLHPINIRSKTEMIMNHHVYCSIVRGRKGRDQGRGGQGRGQARGSGCLLSSILRHVFINSNDCEYKDFLHQVFFCMATVANGPSPTVPIFSCSPNTPSTLCLNRHLFLNKKNVLRKDFVGKNRWGWWCVELVDLMLFST